MSSIRKIYNLFEFDQKDMELHNILVLGQMSQEHILLVPEVPLDLVTPLDLRGLVVLLGLVHRLDLHHP